MTGGIASGKSTVAEKLQKLGAAVVSCDKIAHDLYLPGKKCYDTVLKTFGPSIMKSDGFIDRKALANIVFNDLVGFYFIILLTVFNIIIFKFIFINVNGFLDTVRQIK